MSRRKNKLLCLLVTIAALWAGVSAISCESGILSGPSPSGISLTATPTVTSGIDSLRVSFCTSKAATARIEYGRASGSYCSVVDGGDTDTSHTLDLTSLDPGTVYYYRVLAVAEDDRAYTSAEYCAATTAEEIPSERKARGIWLLGGISGATCEGAVAAVDLYDPVTGAWYDTVTSIPTPVSFAGYAAYDGRLFIIGGFDKDGTVRDLVQVYDIGENSWSSGEAMNAARANVKASVVGGKVYVLGGSYGPLANTNWNSSNTNYEYSAAGDTWTVGGRAAFGAAGCDRFSYAYNNVLYDLGGRTGAATLATTHDGYVPAYNALLSGSTEVPFSAGRTGFAGDIYAPSDGGPAFLIVIGGITAIAGTPPCFVNGGTATASATNIAGCLASPFTAPSGWITAATAYPQYVAYGAAAVSTAVSPARVYHFGGTIALSTSAMGLQAGYWSAVPSSTAAWTSSWTLVTMPRGRWGHGAVTLNE